MSAILSCPQRINSPTKLWRQLNYDAHSQQWENTVVKFYSYQLANFITIGVIADFWVSMSHSHHRPQNITYV